MSVRAQRTAIWIAIAIAFVRGLWVFDGGLSADTHETSAAGACLAGALVAAAIMFCFDTRPRAERPPGARRRE